MDLSNDKRRVTLRIDGTLDAPGLGKLIDALAEVRAQMQPAVEPTWRPTVDFASVPDPVLNVTLVDSPHGDAPEAPLRLLLALRHTGLGWCCFDFDLQVAALLRDYIASRTAGIAVQGVDDVRPVGGVQ